MRDPLFRRGGGDRSQAPNLAEGDGEGDGGVAGVVDGYDPAATAAGVGGEVSEVREPRHGAGAATGAAELPGP